MEIDYRKFLHANSRVMEMLETAKRSADTMIDRLPAAFAVLNETGEILRANDRMASLFAKPTEEVRGSNILQVHREEDAKTILTAISTAIKTGLETVVQVPILPNVTQNSTEERQILWNMSVYSDSPHFTLVGILGIDFREI